MGNHFPESEEVEGIGVTISTPIQATREPNAGMARYQSVIELTLKPIWPNGKSPKEKRISLLGALVNFLRPKLEDLSPQQHGCERIMHMLVRLRRLRHRRATYLADLSARENYMLVRDMYRVNCKRSESTKRNGPHRQQCVNENNTS
jgi:hypothetical protein